MLSIYTDEIFYLQTNERTSESRPVEGVDFDKTLALPPLKMSIFLPNKDFIPLPQHFPEMQELLVSKGNFSGTNLAVVSK